MENKVPKALLIFGSLAAVLLSFGTFFKLMHWPFANILLMLGTVLFTLFYLPLWLISTFKQQKKIPAILQFMVLLLTAITYLWKTMHWPAAGIFFNLWLNSSLYIFFPIALFILFRSGGRSLFSFHIVIVLFLLASLVIGGIGGSASGLVNMAGTFSKNTDYISHSIEKLKVKNDQLYNAFAQSQESTNANDRAKTVRLKKLSDSAMNYLQHFRNHIIALNENISENQADTISLGEMRNMLNKEVITSEICGTNEFGLRKGKYSGLELKNVIDTYRDSVINLASAENRNFIRSGINLDTEPVTNEDGESINWVAVNFRYVTAPMFLHIIENLKFEVTNAETQVLTDLLNNSKQNSQSMASKIAELGSKLENEKKAREIEKLKSDRELAQIGLDNKNKDIQTQNKIIISFVVVLLVCSVLIFFIIRSNMLRRKMNEELAKQKHLIEEKNKEILDSITYAKRIQQAQLPTRGYLDKNFGRLRNNNT